VLEFLLLNHPLDCPICDQGGECDLQDQSLFFGIAKKRFYNFKRVVTDKNIGPIVKTVMTRCIHCTRCVRFAAEIAGTEDLGMFGRGLDSEIGTYVTKTFQSELSGNIIDLCPVGALTSKPYPFVSRSWELKSVNSLDFSDGFATNTQVYLKNNSVVKVNPEYDTHANTSNWISDKTRFAFDGMFSPERVLKGFIKSGISKTIIQNTWKTLLDEITMTLYFQDHLSKHFLNMNKLYVIFDANVSMEVVNLLKMFSNKYSFLKIRKAENGLKNNDFEQNFTTNNHNELTKQLNNSNLCLLVGLNSRYESSSLNVKLRKRYLSGDFNVFSLGASTELTFPVEYLGLNIENLKSIAEGNNSFCQKMMNSEPTVVVSSSIFQRKDSETVLTLLNSIVKASAGKHNKKNIKLNIINSTINETGVKYLNKFKTFNENDLNCSNGLYFLNTSSRTSNLKKIINLKLLKYLETSDTLPKFCLEQNNGLFANVSVTAKSSYKVYNYINLPNSTFFETGGTFLNTEGIFKKTVKFISTNKQTKEDWQIIRKIFACSKNINFANNCKDNYLLSFNNNNLSKFKTFNGFLSIANSSLTSKENIHLLKPISDVSVQPFKVTKGKKFKIFGTKFKIWINDFYIGGKDLYSKQSSTMIKCSKALRNDKHTFTHLN